MLALLALWPSDRLHQVPVRSVWVTVFGFEPYSTGMMRGLSRLLHGDLEGAYTFNRLVFVAFAVMVVLLVTNSAAWWRERRAATRTAPVTA